MNDLKEFAIAIGQIQGGGFDGGSTRTQGSIENTPLVVFVRRLWEMVTDGVIVHWHHTGLAIVVNVRLYETNVRRLHSKHNRTNNFSFFHRQLTCHGFIRLTRDHLDDCLGTDPRLAVFFHGCFRRDKPDLLWKIRSLPRVETGDRVNTHDSCILRRDRQTVDFVPLPNTARTAAGEPGYGGEARRPPGMAVPHIPESGQIPYRGRNTSQPSTRKEQSFADGPIRSFVRRQMSPPTCAAKRRRTASERPSHMIPIARLPEIIFVPHLVTVNGLVPLEPCYDSWKNASVQKERALRPWPKRGPCRGSQGDGNYVMHHPSFPACPHPTTVPQDITPSTASCDVTGEGRTRRQDASVSEVMCRMDKTSSGDDSATNLYCSNGDSSAATNDHPPLMRLPDKRSQNFEVEEPLETRVSYNDDTKKEGCVQTPTKIEVTLSTTDAAAVCELCVFDPSPPSVWQRPPLDMNPVVKLDKLPL